MVPAGQIVDRLVHDAPAGKFVFRLLAEIGKELVARRGNRPVVMVDVFLADARAEGPHPERKLHQPRPAVVHGLLRADDLAVEQGTGGGARVEVGGAHVPREAGAVVALVAPPVARFLVIDVALAPLRLLALLALPHPRVIGHRMDELAGGVFELPPYRAVEFRLAIRHQPSVPGADHRVLHRPRQRRAVVVPLRDVVGRGEVALPIPRRAAVHPVEPGEIGSVVGIDRFPGLLCLLLSLLLRPVPHVLRHHAVVEGLGLAAALEAHELLDVRILPVGHPVGLGGELLVELLHLGGRGHDGRGRTERLVLVLGSDRRHIDGRRCRLLGFASLEGHDELRLLHKNRLRSGGDGPFVGSSEIAGVVDLLLVDHEAVVGDHAQPVGQRLTVG